MHQAHSFRSVVAAAVLASVPSVAAFWFVHAVVISPASVLAQQPGAPDVVLYAAPRGDGDDESFIFYDKSTGDLRVYRDRKIRVHYRLTELGADLEKIPVDRSALRGLDVEPPLP